MRNISLNYQAHAIATFLFTSMSLLVLVRTFSLFFYSPSPNKKIAQQSAREKILYIATEINLIVARTICYSSTAYQAISHRDEWFEVMTSARIAAYSKAPHQTHLEKVLQGRKNSEEKRIKQIKVSKDQILTLEQESKIVYNTGQLFHALNCSGQAKMAYFLLLQHRIYASCLSVSDIDHHYLGLQEEKNGHIFAIMDPWTGQLFLLNSEQGKRYGRSPYHLFEGRTVRHGSIFLDENNKLTYVSEAVVLKPGSL